MDSNNMASKWRQFKKDYYTGSTKSPFDLKTVNKGKANIIEDWNRVDAGPILINGVSIQTLLQQDRGLKEPPKSGELFDNETELKTFFKKHLLKDMVANDQQKELMLIQMMKFLHQGALQTPVSSAASMTIGSKTNYQLAPNDARAVIDDDGEKVTDSNGKIIIGQVRELHFKATPEGFTVEEQLTQNMLTNRNGEGGKIELISPDSPKTKPYVYKARAEISVDFSKNPSSPLIKIEESTINYGNEQIESLFDDRNFLQKFIDGILLALGFRTIDKVANVVDGETKAQVSPAVDGETNRPLV